MSVQFVNPDAGHGLALITDMTTGEVIRCWPATAIENVANGQGRFEHGDQSAKVPSDRRRAPEPKGDEPAIALKEEGTLPLPDDAKPTGAFNGADESKFDHDGDGKPGGSRPRGRPRKN
ncbi:MAG: hypothetical protein ACK4E3_03605 [Brevundimonas sp.]|uniref:hypothetical protein n=1 Tax=Brevundimonas sp. TaxID=1871086 RepID=UPI00391B12C0